MATERKDMDMLMEMNAFVEQSKVPLGLVFLGMIAGGVAAVATVPSVLESTCGRVLLWDAQCAYLYFMVLRRAVCLSALAMSTGYFLYSALHAGFNRLSYGTLYGLLKAGCAMLSARAICSAVDAGLVFVCPKAIMPLKALWGWNIVQLIDLGVVLSAIPLLLQAFEALQAKAFSVRMFWLRLALLTIPFATVGGATLCREAVWAWSLRLVVNS